MNFVARLVTRSNLEWASLFVGFAIIWMVSGLFVQEPEPPALIEKKDPVIIPKTKHIPRTNYEMNSG